MAMITSEYKNWIGELKQRIRQSQIKAAVRVNTELLQLYWQLGSEIVEKQQNAKWGDGFLKQLSADLMTEFTEMKGFSVRNLQLICRWYEFYNQGFINAKQLVSHKARNKKNVVFVLYVVFVPAKAKLLAGRRPHSQRRDAVVTIRWRGCRAGR